MEATFIKSMQIRHTLTQALKLGLVVSSVFIIWKGLVCITGCKSPVVVVLSGSMEPGFQRGHPIPIFHRVIEVHERRGTKEVDVLTKGTITQRMTGSDSYTLVGSFGCTGIT